MGYLDELAGYTIAGKYTLESCIGRGGFSAVYRAIHLAMERVVAIKVLDPYGNQELQEASTQRFTREARVISQLDHPNTITVFDYGTSDEMLYIVIEYIDGLSLHQMLARDGVFASARAVPLVLGILGSLEEAHHYGILHRDLKPANIMITQDFRGSEVVKVLDFGIAKWISDAQEEGSDGALTQENSFVGTPRYAAPEQVFGQDLSEATDIYGVGMLMWNMLLGKPAMQSRAWRECVEVHLLQRDWKVPLDANIPLGLVRILERALCYKPNDRYTSCRDMRKALQKWQKSLEQHVDHEGVKPHMEVHLDFESEVTAEDGTRVLGPSELHEGARAWSGFDASSHLDHDHELDLFVDDVGDGFGDEDSIVLRRLDDIIDPNIVASDFDFEPSSSFSRGGDFWGEDFDSELSSVLHRQERVGVVRSQERASSFRPQRTEAYTHEVLELADEHLGARTDDRVSTRVQNTSDAYSRTLVQDIPQDKETQSSIIKVAAMVVSVTIVLGVGFGLVLKELQKTPASFPDEVEPDATRAHSEIDASDVSKSQTLTHKRKSMFSFDGILRAIRTDGWKVMRVSAKTELSSYTQQTMLFRKGTAQVEVVLMESLSQEMQEGFIQNSKFPARVVVFETKSVRLVPKNRAARPLMGEFESHLKRYKRLVTQGQ